MVELGLGTGSVHAALDLEEGLEYLSGVSMPGRPGMRRDLGS
jgi:hypothetical protein